MASWYYAANGDQQGPVEDGEILRLLREGRISGATLVWHEGMPDWVPLASVRHELQEDLSELMPKRGEAPEGPGQPLPAPPSPVAGGAAGGGYGAGPGQPGGTGAAGTHLMSGPVYDTSGEDFEPDGPPWEDLSLPFFTRLWETLRTSLFQPRDFFANMRRTSDFAEPLKYYVILFMAGTLVSLIWQVPMQMMSLGAQGQQGGMEAAAGTLLLGFCCALIVMPVFAVIGAFISAGIYHLSLMIFGGANEGFETTFRVSTYTLGATSVLNAVPCIGGCLSAVWWLVMMIIGLQEAHKTDGSKAALAVLLPMIVCCTLLGVLLFAFIIPAFAAAMSGTGGPGGGGF